jgi:hypothetical protein
MRFIKNGTALVASLILGFLGQQCLGGTLADPKMNSGGVIGSVTSIDLNEPALARIAKPYFEAVDKFIRKNNKLPSKGVTIYLNKDAKKLVAVAIGAGTGDHGEENVRKLCQENNIPFRTGWIFTYSGKHGFIPACGLPNINYPDNRNCQQLIENVDIKDIHLKLKEQKISKRFQKVRAVESELEELAI